MDRPDAREGGGVRRFNWITLVMTVTATMASAGCGGGSPGGDADPAFRPEVGHCHRVPLRDTDPDFYEPVSCAQPHVAETVHVGVFEGSGAGADEPPVPGATPMRRAYDDCDAAASRYVGAEWRTARLALRISAPSPAGWSAGQRWFRCDLSEIESIDQPVPSERAGGLRDVLRTTSALNHGCYRATLKEGEVTALAPASCVAPHDSEFVAVTRPRDDAAGLRLLDEEDLDAQCTEAIEDFVGSDPHGVLDRLDMFWWAPSEDDWEAGDRGMLCFLWTDDLALTRSLRDADPKSGASPR